MALCVLRKMEELQIMAETKLSEIMALKEKSLAELKATYEELFEGKKAASNNKIYIWRKIAYRIQELEQGGLSVEAQGKIDEFIKNYDPVNNKSLRPTDVPGADKKTRLSRDKRLPIPGTLITKEYKGRTIEIKVLENGFEYNSKTHKSLTAIAKEVTGAHWNGYLFFNL